MQYFTLRMKTFKGELLFESDFRLSEFVPLIGQILSSLKINPHYSDVLQDFKVVITPQYEGISGDKEFIDRNEMQVRDGKGGEEVLPVSFEVVREQGVDSQLFNLMSYSKNAQSRHLCSDCSIRSYCPWFASSDSADVAGWIVLDKESPITNEPISYFTIRIETTQGERIYEQYFSIVILWSLLARLIWPFFRANRLLNPTKADYLLEVIARHDGDPQIDPLPVQNSSTYNISETMGNDTPVSGDIPFPSLVNWEQIEQDQSPEDIMINFIDTKEEVIPIVDMPDPEKHRSKGGIVEKDLHIFVSRFVLEELRSKAKDSDHEEGGVLVGKVSMNSMSQPFIEIVGAITVPPRFKTLYTQEEFILDYSFWRLVEKKLAEKFIGSRILGWYRVHLPQWMRSNIVTTYQTLYMDRDDVLALRKDEHFLYKTFFREPWQTGLIVGSSEGEYRFFQWQANEIVECSGYFVLD